MGRLSIGGRVKVINRRSWRYGQEGTIVKFQRNDIDFAERIARSALEAEIVEANPAAEYDDWDGVTEIDPSEEPAGNQALRSVIVSFDESAFQYEELQVLTPPLQGMTYDVLQDANNPTDWRAEAIDDAGEGECYVVTFTGPRAEERAREYARWKNEPKGE